MKNQNLVCKWRKGWPKQPGLYIVELVDGDIIAIRVECDSSNPSWLVYHDESNDGIVVDLEIKNFEQLEEVWGVACNCYGPIPPGPRQRAKCRSVKTV